MNSHKKSGAWRRMIAFIYQPTFGISVERLENPALAGRPLVLLHSATLPLATEVSAEALAAGIAPGMPWEAASATCPGLARVVARPVRYAGYSDRLLAALTSITPSVEAFAPGEAFLDLTPCQAYYRFDPLRIAALMHAQAAAAGLPPGAIGIAGDKTTARWAARQAGSGATRVIPPDATATALAPVPLAELCGAGPDLLRVLADHGVLTCGDMRKVPIGLPARHFGNLGRRLWLMAQGQDPAPVQPRQEPGPDGAGPGILAGLGKTLPPVCQDLEQLLAAYGQLAGKLLQRLQREGVACREFRVGLRAPEGWRQARLSLDDAPEEAAQLLRPCRQFLRRHWFGEPVRHIRLLALVETRDAGQEDLFRRRSGRTGRSRNLPLRLSLK